MKRRRLTRRSFLAHGARALLAARGAAVLRQRAMASPPGRPNDHRFLSAASTAARRIVLQGAQTISTPVRWDAGDYEVGSL